MFRGFVLLYLSPLDVSSLADFFPTVVFLLLELLGVDLELPSGPSETHRLSDTCKMCSHLEHLHFERKHYFENVVGLSWAVVLGTLGPLLLGPGPIEAQGL